MTDWKTFLYLGGLLLGVIVLGLVLGLERHVISETFESKQEETNQNHQNESQEEFTETISITNPIDVNQTVKIQNGLEVNGLIKAGDPIFNARLPSGWSSKGIHAFDIYANGTIGSGTNGNVNSKITNDGQLCLGNTCITHEDLRGLKTLLHDIQLRNRIQLGSVSLQDIDGRLNISKPVNIHSNQHQGLIIYGHNNDHNYMEFRKPNAGNARGRWIGYSGGHWTGR
jgi:hypothetical protein